MDGRSVIIKSEKDEIIQPDQWKIFKGEGMPKKHNPSESGDLHAKIKVNLPKKLSAKQMELAKTFDFLG